LRMRAKRPAALASIHSVTSANALHYGFLAAPDPKTRFLLLLQAVGWMGQFRTFAGSNKENLRQFRITDLEPSPEDAPADRRLAEIFLSIPSSPEGAAARVFGIGSDPVSRQAFLSAAMRHSITKADEVHYYKYLGALV